MKKTSTMTAVAFVSSLLLAGAALGQTGQTGQQEQMRSPGQAGMTGQAAQAGQQQIRTASDIQNFEVQTAAGEKVGKVDKVVVDLERGQIGYVIVSAAQGSDQYIIPWKALRSQPQQQTLVLNLSQDRLQQAPKGDMQQISDRQRGREIHQFYGVSPYWEETGMQQRGMQQREQMQQHRDQMQQQRDQMQQRTPQPPTTTPRPGM
ncbi:MAG: PRC-barrel domain-containing protein [Desulfuromonadales bacterium]|nr:PRC-barrel domain-containing protein [Desulfuromonadales bacterium]